jgi:hypothetical protein
MTDVAETGILEEKLSPAEKAQNDKEEALQRQIDAFKSEAAQASESAPIEELVAKAKAVCIAIVCLK